MAGLLAIAWSRIRNVTSGRLLGRVSSGTGRAEELTPAQVRSLCSVYSTSEVDAIAAAKAPLASPALTGTPTAPTAAPGTNTTQLATTAFVSTAVSGGASLPLSGGTLTGNLLFSADNTHTIGAAGATRPSAIHVGTGGVTSAGIINCPNGSNYIKIDSANDRIEFYRAAITQSYIQAAAAANAVEITTGLITGGNAKITGRIAATGALRSGSEFGVSEAAGVLDLWSPPGGDCFVAWTQSGLANRGVLGFSAGSGTLRYRAAATSMSTGTEVFTLGSTGDVTCAGITASGLVSVGTYTVATLPAAGSNAGKMAQVTDSNVAAAGNFGATVAGGGANRVSLFCDGTNWVIA